MTLGASLQPSANRDDLTLGIYAFHPLKGYPTANRGPATLGSTPSTVRQPYPFEDGTPEARRALESRAPAHLHAGPKSQALVIDYGPPFGAVAQDARSVLGNDHRTRNRGSEIEACRD